MFQKPAAARASAGGAGEIHFHLGSRRSRPGKRLRPPRRARLESGFRRKEKPGTRTFCGRRGSIGGPGAPDALTPDPESWGRPRIRLRRSLANRFCCPRGGLGRGAGGRARRLDRVSPASPASLPKPLGRGGTRRIQVQGRVANQETGREEGEVDGPEHLGPALHLAAGSPRPRRDVAAGQPGGRCPGLASAGEEGAGARVSGSREGRRWALPP